MLAIPRPLTALLPRLLVFLTLSVLGSASAFAAEGHEALPLHAERVFELSEHIYITNSMIMVWVVALVLVAVAQLATKRMTLVPKGVQNFVEWLVECLFGFFSNIMGEHLAKRTFWFLATCFILILFTNWAGLIPGVGTIGFELQGKDVAEGDQFRPFFRGANADLNLTMAMSLTFFALWFYWSLTEIGPANFVKHIFAPKGQFKGIMMVLMASLFMFVGLIEVLSIAVRPVALMFRLYGNVYAGESMLETLMTMFNLPAWLQWLPAMPFYFLELLVGFVQALVFVLLCAVFTKLMCEHHDDHDHDEEGEGEDAKAEAPASTS